MESKEARYDRRMTADSLPFRLLLPNPGCMGQSSPGTCDRLPGGAKPRPSGAAEGRSCFLIESSRETDLLPGGTEIYVAPELQREQPGPPGCVSRGLVFGTARA